MPARLKALVRTRLDALAFLWLRFRRSVQKNGLPTAILRSFRRLGRAIARYGLTGTAKLAANKPKLAATRVPPHPFDLRHGTDTGGFISGGAMLGSGTASGIVAYYGVSPSTLQQAIPRIPAPLDAFTFVDLGCGKGRALLVAAGFPFRQLLGVELSPELCHAATRNLPLFPSTSGRATILHHDATTLTYPDTPLVVFLYDPFYAPVLRRVLANLERQLRQSPRETYILYAANRYLDEFARLPFLQLLWDDQIPLSAEDAAVDRHRLTHEHYTLHRATL